MKEKRVDFETAKLAKEKSFLIPNYFQYWYSSEGKLKEIIISEPKLDWTQAPTQSMLQAWLRDEHKIRVFVKQGVSGNFNFEIYTLSEVPNQIGKWERIGNIVSSDTYELALEKGLELGLNLIKTK